MTTHTFRGLLVLVGLLTTACDKRLDVQPTQDIDQSTALNTEQDVRATLVGAYDGISDADVYGGAIQFTEELLGDDREVVFGGTFANLDEIWRKSVVATNSQVEDTWLDSYDAINRANNVLSALDKVSAESRDRIEGEALFIRGITYFGLVKLFAKAWGDGDNGANPGVPLVLTPTGSPLTEADNRPRGTVAEVYAQILTDLTGAAAKLPVPSSGDNPGFATRLGAQAMLARVYLVQGNFAAARDAANRVIDSKGPLTLGFADVFADQTSQAEILFKVIVTDQDGTNAMNNYYASVANQGRGDIRVQSKHVSLYDTTDVRATFFNTSNNGARRFTSKFNDRFGDVPVVRLAEMYLIRAEANFRLGTAIGVTPLADVNAVRNRAEAIPLTDATLTLEAVLRERKLELAFEGLQLSDLKRNRGSLAIAGAVVPFRDNRLVLPIPQREIDTNPALKGQQNPGY